MSDTKQVVACKNCDHSDGGGTVCRRYPPVPKTEHGGWMRKAYDMTHDGEKSLFVEVVESAFPATFPYAVCGEWREKP